MNIKEDILEDHENVTDFKEDIPDIPDDNLEEIINDFYAVSLEDIYLKHVKWRIHLPPCSQCNSM